MESILQEELVEELLKVQTLARENPCGMSPTVLKSIIDFVRNFICHNSVYTGSKDQVAIYFNRDVRTITRWQQQFTDFPKPRHNGHHDVSYDWYDIICWKLKHKDLLENNPSNKK